MDRFTRNYILALLAIFGTLTIWALYEKPEVASINRELAADPELSRYPYPFRVFSLEDGVAIVGTPRSVEFPAYKTLPILFPRLAGRSPGDPELMQAQKELAEIQQRVRTLVMKSPAVKTVRWKLDVNWLTMHGAQLVRNRPGI